MNKRELIERINNTLFDNLKDTLFTEPTLSITESTKDNKVAITFETEQGGVLVGGMLKKFEKVTIPRFIADWIVQAKEDGYNIAGAIHEAPKGEVDDWLELNNVDIFAEAWVNGYRVEEEKRYRVKLKGINSESEYLYYGNGSCTWRFREKNESGYFRKNHTRKELKDAGFGEVFNSQMFEVEEVEE